MNGKDFFSKIVPFLILALFAFSFLSFFSSPQKEEKIAFSGIVQKINSQEISKISILGNELDITTKDGKKLKSTREEGENFLEDLKSLGADPEKLKEVEIEFQQKKEFPILLGTFLLSVLPLILMLVFFWMLFRQAKTGAMQSFDFTKAKARLFGAGIGSQEKVFFKDVGGLREAKEELKEVVDFLKNPQKYLRMGAKIPRGVLLVGPPGTGKTMLARAVASEANVPFFSISGSEFTELFVGVGPARVRDLFSTAKRHQPCIIYIDELDAIGRTRGLGISGGQEEREQTLNQILVEMDGFEQNVKITVLSSTNRPDVLDSALLRPGRFDRRIVLDLPDIEEREAILKIHSRGKPLAIDIHLREIAERTPGFSGADLANLVNEAAILAARKNQNQIFEQDLLESVEKVLLGPERKSHILSKKEKDIVAFHEAGHALVSASLPEAEPVRKVSIIARGMAAGYTLKMPKEERKIKTKSEFLAEMATLLGGYCAEKLKYGEITTGAAIDLKVASQLARKLVKEYGMSSLGPVAFGQDEELFFWGKESEGRNYSEKVAARIDEEVTMFIKGAEKRATEILTKKKTLLEKIANTLIEKETIEKEEFDRIIRKE